MTNREKTKKIIAVAFDFVDQIPANPEMLGKIPDGSTIRFLYSGKENSEMKFDKGRSNMTG